MDTERTEGSRAESLIRAMAEAYALRKAGADIAGERAAAAAIPQDFQDAQAALVARVRDKVRADLQFQASQIPGDESFDLADRLRDLDGLETIDQIERFAMAAFQEIALRMAEGGSERLYRSDRERQAALNAAHRRLYGSDALYREEVDRLMAAADADRAEAERRSRAIDALLAEHGIATSVDDDLTALSRRRTEAAQLGNHQEAFAIDADIARLRQQQLGEARDAALAAGKSDVVEALDAERSNRDQDAERANERREEGRRAFRQAEDRQESVSRPRERVASVEGLAASPPMSASATEARQAVPTRLPFAEAVEPGAAPSFAAAERSENGISVVKL